MTFELLLAYVCGLLTLPVLLLLAVLVAYQMDKRQGRYDG